jgi:hypothetical protein
METAFCKSLIQRHLDQRAELDGCCGATTAEKILEAVEIGVPHVTLKSNADRLRNRRVYASKNRKAARDFLHGDRKLRMLLVECLRASTARLSFCHFQTTCEIQVHEFHLILLFCGAIEAILGY